MFPLKFFITQEIIDQGRKSIDNSGKCIGALSLKAATGNPRAKWGNVFGEFPIDNKWKTITTQGRIRMMELTEPTEVTFIEY